MFINELAEPQLLIIYPGRFQPFHKGHHAVYEYLTGKFGRSNVYIATSNKVEEPKSPFTFAEKAYFMQLTGVPSDRIVQATQPYNIENVVQGGGLSVADPQNTVAIFAVSQKDMAEDPRFKSFTKKDGSPAYFQPMPKNIKETEGMNRHAYIMVVPTFDFSVMGQPMQSGTELRAMYAGADDTQRQAIVKDLFGRYTPEAEHLMTSKLAPAAPAELDRPTQLPKTVKPAGGVVSESDKPENIRTKSNLIKARQSYPMAKSDEEALILMALDKEERDVSGLDKEEHGLEQRVSNLELKFKQLAQPEVQEGRAPSKGLHKKVAVVKGDYAGKTGWVRQIKTDRIRNKTYLDLDLDDGSQCVVLKQDVRLVKDAVAEEGGTGVIASKKQAKDPRYSMSLTKDVRPGQINKSLRAFDLAEGAVDDLEQSRIGQLNGLMDEIKQRITTEKLPAKYVEAMKQRLDKLKAERDSYYKINTQ